jgi:hypothetical protein
MHDCLHCSMPSFKNFRHKRQHLLFVKVKGLEDARIGLRITLVDLFFQNIKYSVDHTRDANM